MELENVLFGIMTLKDRWLGYSIPYPGLSGKWVEPIILPSDEVVRAIAALGSGQVLVQGDQIIAMSLEDSMALPSRSDLPSQWLEIMEKVPYDGELVIISSLQHLITHNADQIIRDWDQATTSGDRNKRTSLSQIHPESAPNGVTIDDGQGPVIIGDNATILPGAKIMGPIAILPNAVVKMGAELYPGTTIGPSAVVNGEVKNSIFHEHSAKGHAGYLGDSILGRWNNFGAGSTISNVSNTFSRIRIKDWNTGDDVAYETIKRGVITGDFVKLGIMSKVYRGTAIGSFSSIATAQAIRGNVEPLTWWTNEQKVRYEVNLLREHCQRQMKLHGKHWTKSWETRLASLSDSETNAL